jgi:hypothetical protein
MRLFFGDLVAGAGRVTGGTPNGCGGGNVVEGMSCGAPGGCAGGSVLHAEGVSPEYAGAPSGMVADPEGADVTGSEPWAGATEASLDVGNTPSSERSGTIDRSTGAAASDPCAETALEAGVVSGSVRSGTIDRSTGSDPSDPYAGVDVADAGGVSGSRRSVRAGWSADPAAAESGAGAASIRAPHCGQKRSCSATAVPQVGQVGTITSGHVATTCLALAQRIRHIGATPHGNDHGLTIHRQARA